MPSSLRPRIGVSSPRPRGPDRAAARKVRALAGASWRRPPCRADRRPRQVYRSDRTAPEDLDQACAMLAAGDDARIIAGGQTLVPLMAMRLARPKRLIDIARIPDLAFVRHERDGIAIGATTCQCVLERNAIVHDAVPLL